MESKCCVLLLVRHCHISMLYFTNGYIALRDIICIIVFNTVLMVVAMAFIENCPLLLSIYLYHNCGTCIQYLTFELPHFQIYCTSDVFVGHISLPHDRETMKSMFISCLL